MEKSYTDGISPSRPVVVSCPNFDENSGGAIVLHYLVDRLRAIGVNAYAYPLANLIPTVSELSGIYYSSMPRWRRTLKIWNRHRKMKRAKRRDGFQTHPSMNVPVASRTILESAIVVYPEIVPGNPLRARHVVRWLLHRPGFFGDGSSFPADEYLVYFHQAFTEGVHGIDDDAVLRIRWIRDDVYFDRGHSERAGNCRMVRKGKQHGHSAVPINDDAILLDGKSHEEIAAVFNEAKRFYCHDPRTMYLYYAALCGCIPIIVPEPGKTFEDLRPREEERWGIAYGVEGIEWAQDTRALMLNRFSNEQAKQEKMIENFTRNLARKFG